MRRISGTSPYEARIGYCRAVVGGGLVHVSGTTGPDPETGTFPDDVAEQCRNALAIVARALEEAGSGFDKALRVTYILPDRRDFEACWPILAETFGANPPAATMIEAGLLSPGMKFEIELTALA
ncbi:RidA family protein [Pseudoroseicyclus tamaricis]|uniref:RidA family protein n=1 Tax=Pseudoroseicyclus tamaricis TaxID=2705421 RepID=A0A6B2K017_9RHOB|nr:RidA family protein [Pseudoroseicyclus tamaricis]NDV01012.1 RidA family protein [Pseudoroseicyclus tamaricis]